MTSNVRWGGLINQGSTCYLNSVVQALFHLPLFRKKIFEIKSSDKLVVALQSVFCRLMKGEQNISTTDLTSAFGWVGDQVSVQHDVHELIQLLFDRLEKHLKGTEMESFIREIFCGELIYRSEAVDTDLKYTSDRLEKFYDLEVIVKDSASLTESIEKLSTPEKIEGVEVEIAPGKPTKLNIERSLQILNLPPVLMIHPNRVTFDTETYELRTINSLWEFQEQLNLQKYLADENTLKLDKESLEKPREKNAVTSIPGNQKYVLHSILIHSGTTRMGHYYAYIKLDNKWYCFNDEHVSEVLESAVAKSAFGGQGYRNSLCDNERASILIYINEACKNDVLNEEGIVVPAHVLAMKKIVVKFAICGLHDNRTAMMDSTYYHTHPLSSDYTLSDLKSAIASVISRDPSSFDLLLLGRLTHMRLEDIEDFKNDKVNHYRLVVVPTFVRGVMRLALGRPMYELFLSMDYMAEFAQRYCFCKGSGRSLFYVNEKRVLVPATPADFMRINDFVLADERTDAESYYQYFSIDNKTDHISKEVVYVSPNCNGMWETQRYRMVVETNMRYTSAQDRVRKLYKPDVDSSLIAFFRANEMSISFPPLVDCRASHEHHFMDTVFDYNKHSTLYFTVLPCPISNVSAQTSIVFNGGWQSQPHVYLPKGCHRISLSMVLHEALQQIANDVPENFKKRLESLRVNEDCTSVARLLKIADGSKTEEVQNEEPLDNHFLYIIEPWQLPPPGFSLFPVFFWSSSQSQTKYFGLPTFIAIGNNMDETGKTLVERLWKRLRIPESKTTAADLSRWMVFVETDKKRAQKVGLKDVLKDALAGGALKRLLIDRPLMRELDGTPPPPKDAENLVINS